MSVSVRRAEAPDAADLHALARATFALACPPGTTAEAVEDFLATSLSQASFDAYLGDPNREIWVAEDESGLIGYTMLVYAEPTDPDVIASISLHPSCELSKFYVREGHHGAGVSAALMTASLEAASAREAHGIWLGVNQFNPRANRFYEKHGFERVGTKRFLLGGIYEEDFVRERPL